jgi:hypothetical protein
MVACSWCTQRDLGLLSANFTINGWPDELEKPAKIQAIKDKNLKCSPDDAEKSGGHSIACNDLTPP